jgi:hypothetical protein
MACRNFRTALLVGAITAVAVTPAARADHHGPSATHPCTRTIQVTECVPEYYKTKRTCYRVECRQEKFQAFRCERVAEWQEREVVVTKRVPEHVWETRKVCVRVPVCEERTVMKPCYRYVQETCMVKKLVRRGHWECRTECAKPGLFDRLFRKNDCCDPCHDQCADQCARTRTRKVWVKCPVYQECPVTKCRKVCEMVATKVRVNVCRTEFREEKVQVCRFRCVEERVKQRVCVHVTRQVPYEACRTVRVCVPYEVEVTACRMVPRVVTREVPVSAGHDCCAPKCRKAKKRCRGNGLGLFNRRSHDCCSH